MRFLFLITFFLSFYSWAEEDLSGLEVTENSPYFSLVLTDCQSNENSFTHKGMIPDDSLILPSFSLTCALNKGMAVCQTASSEERISFLLNKNSERFMNLSNFPQEEINVNKKTRLTTYTKILLVEDMHYSIFCKGIYSSKSHLLSLQRKNISEGLIKILNKTNSEAL